MVYSEAGKAFEQSKKFDEAMKLYLKAENFDKVAWIIIKSGMDYLITGRDKELAVKIKSLPEEYIEKETWSFFLFTLTDRIKGGIKNLNQLKNSFTRFSEEKNIRGKILSLAYLIEASVFLGKSPEKLKNRIDREEQLLEKIAGTELYIYICEGTFVAADRICLYFRGT